MNGVVLLVTLVLFVGGPSAVTAAAGVAAPDRYTLVGDENFLTGYPPLNPDGSINVVIEIPAGTTAKWEVDKEDGDLEWERVHGEPRIVDYLGYPGNYGMVPRTTLPEEHGGDGDPLDVLVLGPAVPRGSVVAVRVIGVLEMLDGGERDDKLLAVRGDSALGEVSSLEDLDTEFPGVTEIVELWFSNYKGPGVMKSGGFADAERARAIIAAASKAFEQAHAERAAASR